MGEDRNSSIHWHPAFVEAIKMELIEYLDKIEIQSEVPLTAEPLKIDCIIIKKSKDLVIKKNIAGIFRDWNIIEYKSPQDHVSINDFHKVYAYACLYSVIKNEPVENISISFVESRYPKKLIDFLEKVRKFKVEKTSSGIYNVKGDIFAIQIIDSLNLTDYENLWLKNLSNELDENAINKVISEIEKQEKTVSLGAYWDVVNRANAGLFEEVLKMRAPTFKQMLMNTEIGAGWLKEWKSEAEAQGMAQGMAQGKAQGMAQGMAQGLAQGMAQGIAKGKAEAMAQVEAKKAEALAQVARNLKTSGMSQKLISQYTGLSLAKIRKL